VNGHSLISTRIAISKRNEVAYDSVIRAGTIRVLHLVYLNLVARKAVSIVELVVEPDDALDVHVEELVDQVVRPHITADACSSGVHRVLRRREGDDLVGHYPAQIPATEHLLELKAVKSSLRVPVELNCALESFQAINDR
jgi:hypothetical protein